MCFEHISDSFEASEPDATTGPRTTAPQDVTTLRIPQRPATSSESVQTGYTLAVIDDLLNNIYDQENFDENGVFHWTLYTDDVTAVKAALIRFRNDVMYGTVVAEELIDTGWTSGKVAE